MTKSFSQGKGRNNRGPDKLGSGNQGSGNRGSAEQRQGGRRRPGMNRSAPQSGKHSAEAAHSARQPNDAQTQTQSKPHDKPQNKRQTQNQATTSAPMLQVAVVLGPHGIKGQARLKVFVEEPMALADFNPLHDANGKTWKVKPQVFAKGVLIAQIEGLRYRDQVEALKGLKLLVPPSALPDTDEDEFYPYELEGLKALRPDGSVLGEVVNLRDYGAGDLLNVRLAETGKLELYPFSKAVVPEIKVSEGYLIIDPPGEIISRDEDGVH